MTPWLHFTGGDNFFFKSLHPSSHGAIAAACVVLVLIAIFERWVSALRGVLEAHWARSLTSFKSAATAKATSQATSATGRTKESSTKESEPVDIDVQSLQGTPSEQHSLLRSGRVSRLSPPFIASHDLPRGAIFAFQALLAYLLMLAVMTFQAAYIISIVAGLGIGEVLFGRMGSARSHIPH